MKRTEFMSGSILNVMSSGIISRPLILDTFEQIGPGAQVVPSPEFIGANLIAYRLDADGVLRLGSSPFPNAAQKFASGNTPLVSLTPLYFNAPTFFKGNSKPTATVALSLQQHKALAPLTSQQAWSVLYPLITAPNQDINSQSFVLAPTDLQNLAGIPLPDGRGVFRCPVGAVVGGDLSKTFQIILDAYSKLRSITGAAAATIPVVALPAASLFLADQIESLVQQVLAQFKSGQTQQYWVNKNPVNIAVSSNGSAADPGALTLPFGTTTVVLFPAQSNPKDLALGSAVAVDYENEVKPFVGNKSYLFGLNGSNALKFAARHAIKNPFDNIPYITLSIDVDNTPP